MTVNHWYIPLMLNDQHQLIEFAHACSKVVCVGRNYKAHAQELNNPVPDSPLLFIKPNSSLAHLNGELLLPAVKSGCHYELEIAVLIGVITSNISVEQSRQSIAGIGVGLDLTLRALQTELKGKGHPWEKAKAFDGACPVASFIPYNGHQDLKDIEFSMLKNGQIAQHGNSRDMVFSVEQLISEISHHFTLYPGDIVMTGTPAGVGELSHGDNLKLYLADQLQAECDIVSESTPVGNKHDC